MKRIPIIFSGWNLRAVIAFCRFCRMRLIPFYIVAKNEDDPILLSDYKKNVILIRQNTSLSISLVKEVVEIVKSMGGYSPVLMPLTEFLNRFFLGNRMELEAMGCLIPLCDNEIYELISDKFSFENLCKQHGISTPTEYKEITAENIPCVIKPKRYFFDSGKIVADKPKLIMTLSDFEKLGEIDQSVYYSQQFVGGGVYYLLYYFSKDGMYKLYSQKNLVQQHCGLSIVAAESTTIHNDPRVERYTKLFQNIGFHGLVMVEIRDYEGRLYMIEANPRLWGPSQLILDAGMDLFDVFAVENGLLENVTPANYKQGVKYAWIGGFMETSSKGEKLVFHNNYTATEWINHISEWFDSDIYRREDTMRLFNAGV